MSARWSPTAPNFKSTQLLHGCGLGKETQPNSGCPVRAPKSSVAGGLGARREMVNSKFKITQNSESRIIWIESRAPCPYPVSLVPPP